MRPWLLASVLLALGTAHGQEPPKPARESLSIEDIIRLSKAGVSDDVIISRLKGNAKAFDLNADEILQLKKSGVSDAVVTYMEDPTRPYSSVPVAPPPAAAPGVAPPPQVHPPVSPPKPPRDPLALKVPPDPGIYYLTAGGDFLALNLRMVVPLKQPGKIGRLVKDHIIGSIVGVKATTRIPALAAATFYIRLEEKTSVDDLTLLLLDKSGTRRDLDFGAKPGKPVFRVNSIKSFESKNVAPGLFRLVVSPSSAGEYLFYVLGSGDDKKGLLGRGYDFGAD